MADDPFFLFDAWYTEAKESEPNDPNAMALATADAAGRVSVRMVLLKGHGPDGFVFYTNRGSRKAAALAENMQAGLLFHWKSLRRQIRIDGPVAFASDEESDAYFATRGRDSQLGAWASNQSHPLDARETFEARFEEMKARFDGRDVTREDAARRCRAGIARSFQVPRPFAGMTVFENVLVGATFGRAAPGAADHAMRALALSGLGPKANVLAGALPLLDRKRLELARALATEPRLLLLDEIAGGLTDSECHALLDVLREVHASGVTIVWVEHVVHALLSVAQRLVVVNFGRKIADGPPGEVMRSREVRSVYLGEDAHA